jgi:hypothetical protein
MDASNQAAWWKPLDEFGGAHYLAYNAWGGPGQTNGGPADTHTVYVARHDPDGRWARGALGHDGESAIFDDDIGHKQPSVAVDGHGRIHVFAAMHGGPWIYYRSSEPGDVTSMADCAAEMPDQADGFTYPVVGSAANGDLYLIVRAGPNGRLYRWDDGAGQWSRRATFASASGFLVYPDDVVCDGAGNVHIAWEWAPGTTGGLRHLGSYLRYDPVADRFANAKGTIVTVPVSTVTADRYQPLEGTEKASGTDDGTEPPGLQSAKLAISPATGRPAVAYRYRSESHGLWRVRLADWTGSAWARSVVYAGAYQTTAAVDISRCGTGIRVYYAKAQTATGDQAFAATRQSDGSWSEACQLPGVAVERLSVIRRGETDYLYLAAPGAQKLYFGTSTW